MKFICCPSRTSWSDHTCTFVWARVSKEAPTVCRMPLLHATTLRNCRNRPLVRHTHRHLSGNPTLEFSDSEHPTTARVETHERLGAMTPAGVCKVLVALAVLSAASPENCRVHGSTLQDRYKRFLYNVVDFRYLSPFALDRLRLLSVYGKRSTAVTLMHEWLSITASVRTAVHTYSFLPPPVGVALPSRRNPASYARRVDLVAVCELPVRLLVPPSCARSCFLMCRSILFKFSAREGSTMRTIFELSCRKCGVVLSSL